MEVGDKLNPQRSYRKGFALKGLRQHIIKTNNPSTIGPGELLTVRFPDLKENQVTIPKTTKLTFNIVLDGTDKTRTLVKNLGRNIIRKLVVKLEGNEIISIDDYDVLYSYYDCWKGTTERANDVFQGIVEADGQTENAIRHRINAANKASNARDETVASIYDNRFCISSIDFGIYLHTIFHSVFTFTVQSPQNLRSNPYNKKLENGSSKFFFGIYLHDKNRSKTL